MNNNVKGKKNSSSDRVGLYCPESGTFYEIKPALLKEIQELRVLMLM